MLRIHHDLNDTPDESTPDTRGPSKQYADACWQADPRLSPDWWHEGLGRTFGKLALDWRANLHQQDYLDGGCNMVLVSPRTWAQAQVVIGQSPHAGACIPLLVTSQVTPLPTHLPPFVVWQPGSSTTFAQRRHALHTLETLVYQRKIEGYGLLLDTTDPHPLHTWLEEAGLVATTVWERRKRPALQIIMVEQDLLDLSLFTTKTTRHRDEPVSPLELAARLNLTTILLPSALPNASTLPQEALAALTLAAEEENTLNRFLGGWPQIGGQPLFSLLAHVSRGRAPWPTPAIWRNWRIHVWPQLQSTWQHLLSPANRPHIQRYLQHLEALERYGEALSSHAAQPLLEDGLNYMLPRMPEAWRHENNLTRALGVLSSLPGVGAVAVSVPFLLQPLRHLPNLPDVGRLLT